MRTANACTPSHLPVASEHQTVSQSVRQAVSQVCEETYRLETDGGKVQVEINKGG